MYRYTNVAPYSDISEPPLSSPTAPSSSGNTERAGHQAREASLSETASTARTVSSSGSFDAITVKYHALPLNLAQALATLSTETSSSFIASQTRLVSSPAVFALAVSSSTPSAIESETTSSPLLTEITAVPITATAGTGSTAQPSLPSLPSQATENVSSTLSLSESAPAQTSMASAVNIQSARTTGIILGSVLGGIAVLLFAMLAIIYLAWRRRRKRRGQAGRGGEETQQQPNETTSRGRGRVGGGRNDAEGMKRSTESPMTLPLQGTTTLGHAPSAPRQTTLRSEPILNNISPITPIEPHLSRWTLDKAGIHSPAGHPAIIIDTGSNLRHHPLFASTDYDDDDDDDNDGTGQANAVHEPADGDFPSPPSSSSSSLSSSPEPNPPSPAATAAAAGAEAEAEAQALASFLFFDSPSSRSSRRPSTRDSSAPCTALGVPPPLHRGPPPPRRCRHTRAGGSARSRRGSGASVSGAGAAGDGVANSTAQHTPPPPVPARNGARSKSLRDAERPAAWI
ncbi:hypothetical protein DHEL01_v208557 [Diaporthe helianthi]|uniref:Uncharacterized protein n=1 Tax=Diaporthe helianthi TaxID=158607 RepID=A0A2P5HS01_DIAHE|nr:hypothetical protein DHEL01_v208557 [Diaporthe helianthi]